MAAPSPPPCVCVPSPGSSSSTGEDVTSMQLASQTSHLSLSASGNNTEGSPPGAHSSASVLPQVADAQPDGLLKTSSRYGAAARAVVRQESNGRAEADTMMGYPASIVLPGACNANALANVAWDGPGSRAWNTEWHSLDDLPNEVLLHILGFLDVCDLLATSRTCHHLRSLSLTPILHALRLRRTRAILPPLLCSPSRPTLAELIARSIFLTHTTVVSRKLGRSLVAIRLSRRLAARPSAEALVQRCVLPPECMPGKAHTVAPAIVAKKRAIERERVKDGLRRWVGAVWRGEVRERSEGVRRWEERVGVGRVWKLRRFWERVGRGETHAGA